MATEKELHERMKKLDEHLAQVKAELAEMDEDQRVELGGLLEEISDKLTSRGKG
jgi:hypothetical protein